LVQEKKRLGAGGRAARRCLVWRCGVVVVGHLLSRKKAWELGYASNSSAGDKALPAA